MHICHSQQESLTYVYCSFVNIKNHLVVNHYQIRNLRNGTTLVWNTRYNKLCQVSSSANIIANLGNTILHQPFSKNYQSKTLAVRNDYCPHEFLKFGTLVIFICNKLLWIASSCCETDFPPLTVKEKTERVCCAIIG